MRTRWLLGVAAGLVLAVLAIYPQLNLRQIRGAEYNGAFASADLDEMAYASYLQAIIDGRPRLNDPYTGRDATAADPQPESLFSIQFASAYIAAVPARALGLSASQLMPSISIFAAFFTALALFWLLLSITDDSLLAMAGTLIVMTGAALAVGLGAVNSFYDGGVAYPFFPYLRRHIPAVGFPFLFAFFACLWKGINAERRENRLLWCILSTACFTVLVFSYFYLWTTAAAALAALTAVTLLLRSDDWKLDLQFLVATGILSVFALLPYALLLSKRNEIMDKAQLLVHTRQHDLFRNIELIGYAVIFVVAGAMALKILKNTGKAVHFILALAAVPVIVMNQQVVTGRSLQPFHYEYYVVNYVVLLAAVMLAAVIWKKFVTPLRAVSVSFLGLMIAAASAWGYVEARATTVFWDDVNILRDKAMPVGMRLRELAGGDIGNAKHSTTINLEPLQGDSQPTIAPQPVLWARHQHTFAGLHSWEENKLRYYKLLYFSDLDADHLKESLTGCRDIEACMALFGWDRFNATLSANARPLTQPEIEEEVQNYSRFYDNFSRADAEDPHVDYLVFHTNSDDRLMNIDRWFVRDEGETLGDYKLYRLKLKGEE